MADPFKIKVPDLQGLRMALHEMRLGLPVGELTAEEQIINLGKALTLTMSAAEILADKIDALEKRLADPAKAIDFQLLKIDMADADQILLFKFKGPIPREMERHIDAYLERKLRGTGIVHMIVGDGYPEAPQIETIASVVITKPKDDGN